VCKTSLPSWVFGCPQNLLGLRPEDRLSYGQRGYCSYLSETDASTVREAGVHLVPYGLQAVWSGFCSCVTPAEGKRSLFDLIQGWLERTPCLEMGDFKFWDMYESAVRRMLEKDHEMLRCETPGGPSCARVSRALA
jgi:hypothetical protein